VCTGAGAGRPRERGLSRRAAAGRGQRGALNFATLAPLTGAGTALEFGMGYAEHSLERVQNGCNEPFGQQCTSLIRS
jgi:hypothetical protein